jgi:hypothetical protein
MLLALKLLITPLFIGSVTLVGRRWGPVISGLLAGLPLTSGPISLFLALQYGQGFAAKAAVGTLVGQASVCIFCLSYSLISQKWNWLVSSTAAVIFFLVVISVLNHVPWSLFGAFSTLVAVIAIVSSLLPHPPSISPVKFHPPKWDLPARMIIATVFVLLLTAFAKVLGPQLSGLLSPFPVFGLVLAAFTHQQQNAKAAARLLRGIVLGSLAFAGFFIVIGRFLTSLPIGLAYILSTITALVASGISLLLMREHRFITSPKAG